MNVFYDKDCDLSPIKGKQVAILGYGSQGHAHAQNLSESGCTVTVGLRRGGASCNKVEAAGLKVADVNDAVKGADIIMILLPDESIAQVYSENVAPQAKQGATLAFAHGFNIHYGQVVPRADLDVIMAAPKAPGHTVRSTYSQGGGVPHLFGEQAVLCGGAVEPLHELKLIVDLIYEGGIANMNYAISNNAEYGEYTAGPKIVTADTKNAMRQCLKDLQTGEYAKSLMLENRAGAPTLIARRRLTAEHPIEEVGARLRAMMPWIAKNKLVDQSRN
ncbi:NADP-dependent ketol-acid reductoisomerase [Massilia sp. TWR1-2-2]|uniref:NADP-dependent ketol-acid reductoisomerase n=1 Tax=Massilia sp. TWR1-2-2 TaxID=2804584 RepID=UPI003CF007AB